MRRRSENVPEWRGEHTKERRKKSEREEDTWEGTRVRRKRISQSEKKVWEVSRLELRKCQSEDKKILQWGWRSPRVRRKRSEEAPEKERHLRMAEVMMRKSGRRKGSLKKVPEWEGRHFRVRGRKSADVPERGLGCLWASLLRYVRHHEMRTSKGEVHEEGDGKRCKSKQMYLAFSANWKALRWQSVWKQNNLVWPQKQKESEWQLKESWLECFKVLKGNRAWIWLLCV